MIWSCSRGLFTLTSLTCVVRPRSGGRGKKWIHQNSTTLLWECFCQLIPLNTPQNHSTITPLVTMNYKLTVKCVFLWWWGPARRPKSLLIEYIYVYAECSMSHQKNIYVLHYLHVFDIYCTNIWHNFYFLFFKVCFVCWIISSMCRAKTKWCIYWVCQPIACDLFLVGMFALLDYVLLAVVCCFPFKNYLIISFNCH